jgi:hypothetical protein
MKVPSLRTAQGNHGEAAGEARPLDLRQAHQRSRREAKRIREAHRRLDVRERFRLLTDLIDSQRKMIEVADHKARFALVIMGAVNAALLLLVVRGRLIEEIPGSLRPWLLLVVLPYAVLACALLLDAAQVLRPHMLDWTEVARALPPGEAGSTPDQRPVGLMYWGAALRTDYERYSTLWTEARVGQVSAELALLAHGLARVNADQYRYLNRLFRGLRLIVALAALLIAGLAVHALR